MSKPTMNTIKITGKLWLGADSPTLYMKDMLRYDDGTIFSLEHEPGNEYFEAIIVSRGYTPARWLSFGLAPTLVEGTREAWKTQMDITQVIHLKDIQNWVDKSENVKIIDPA
jgi:hypothetical protein